MGQIVAEGKIINSETNIDVTIWSKGIYIVKVNISNKSIGKKIIIP